MKVRILKQAGGPYLSVSKGDEVSLEADVATDLINAGYAEPVKVKKETTRKKVSTETATTE